MSNKGIRARYREAKTARVGDPCTCPSCGTEFIKEHYAQKFCKTKGGTVCKDKYWNTVDPNKRNNTTRISPASARFMADKMMRNIEDDFHPHDPYSLGQE